MSAEQATPAPLYDLLLTEEDRDVLCVRIRFLRSGYLPPLTIKDVAGLAIEWAKSTLSRRFLQRGSRVKPDDGSRFLESAINAVNFVAPSLLVEAGFIPHSTDSLDESDICYLTPEWLRWHLDTEELYGSLGTIDRTTLSFRSRCLVRFLHDARMHAIGSRSQLFGDLAEGIEQVRNLRKEAAHEVSLQLADAPTPLELRNDVSLEGLATDPRRIALCVELRLLLADAEARGDETSALWVDDEGRVRIGKRQVRDHVLKSLGIPRFRPKRTVRTDLTNLTEQVDQADLSETLIALEHLRAIEHVRREVSEVMAHDPIAQDVMPYVRAFLLGERSARNIAEAVSRDREAVGRVLRNCKDSLDRKLGA